MGELIQFPERDSRHTLTAYGRFLLVVEQQEAEAATARARRAARRKPTARESKVARKELDLLFSGPNKDEAERMYRQGLNDVIAPKGSYADTATSQEKFRRLHEFMTGMGIQFYGIATIEQGRTPEALFYIHVERLTETANHAYDRSPEPL